MAHIDPQPDDRRDRTSGWRNSTSPDPVGERSAARSTGTTIAGILLVIGLILLGLMFLTPTRTPLVNSPTPATDTAPPAASVPPTTAAPGTTR